MSSLENHLATSKMLSDSIVSFKTDSQLRRYIQLKTGITKAFFTLGEITAILKTIIGHEKQYDERNPAVIICSPELELRRTRTRTGTRRSLRLFNKKE